MFTMFAKKKNNSNNNANEYDRDGMCTEKIKTKSEKREFISKKHHINFISEKSQMKNKTGEGNRCKSGEEKKLNRKIAEYLC